MAAYNDGERDTVQQRLDRAIRRLEGIGLDEQTRYTITFLATEVRRVIERLEALERWQTTWERPVGE